jgi:hypothetical protein
MMSKVSTAVERLRFIQEYEDQTGKQRTYYRRGRFRRALPTNDGSAAFMRAYWAAAEQYEMDLAAVGKPLKSEPLDERVGRAVFVRIAERLVLYARKRAYVRKIECTIDARWVIAEMEKQGFRCALTGVPFRQPRAGQPKGEPLAPSLDRMDNRLGYTPDNVRVILFGVNVALNQWGFDNLLEISRSLVRNQLKKAA